MFLFFNFAISAESPSFLLLSDHGGRACVRACVRARVRACVRASNGEKVNPILKVNFFCERLCLTVC